MKAYSEDLRARVLAAIDNGEKQYHVAEQFSITDKTIYLWVKQRKDRGHIKPITHYQRGHSHKITNLEQFKVFVIQNSSMSTKELALSWGNIGVTTIKKALRLIGFTRKKRPMAMLIETKKNVVYTRKYSAKYPRNLKSMSMKQA